MPMSKSRNMFRLVNDGKPRESRLIYCTAARRPKLQFSSLTKATRYIQWNSVKILTESSKAPVRAYWCNSCCCYHVTSRPVPRDSGSPERRDTVGRYLREALLSQDQAVSKSLLSDAYRIICSERPGEPWVQEMSRQALTVLAELDRRRGGTEK